MLATVAGRRDDVTVLNVAVESELLVVEHRTAPRRALYTARGDRPGAVKWRAFWDIPTCAARPTRAPIAG